MGKHATQHPWNTIVRGAKTVAKAAAPLDTFVKMNMFRDEAGVRE
jgi:hypothetical protein